MTTAQKLAAVGFINDTGMEKSSGIVRIGTKNYVTKTKIVVKSGFFADLQNGDALKGSDLPKDGVRSLIGNKLAEGTLHLYLGGRISIDTTANTTTDIATASSKDAFLASAAFKSEAPGYVRNTSFAVVQGTPLCDVTLSVLKNDKIANSNQDDFKEFDMFYIRPTVPMNYNFRLPEGVTPVANHAYRLEFDVLELTEVGHA